MPDASLSNPKKPYTAPTLKIFGDLARLTALVGNMGKVDGGTGSMRKTQ